MLVVSQLGLRGFLWVLPTTLVSWTSFIAVLDPHYYQHPIWLPDHHPVLLRV